MPSTLLPMRRLGLAILAAAAALAGAVALWLAEDGGVHRQGPAENRPVTIGVLRWGNVDTATFAGFRAGLAERGYHHVTYLEAGTTGSAEAVRRALSQYLDKGVDLLLVSGTPAVLVAQETLRHTGTPLIFAPVNDPVGSGVVADLRHPGGNVTGIRLRSGDDLRLEWLHRLVPGAHGILVPSNPDDPSSRISVNAIRPVAARLDLNLRLAPVRSTGELDGLLANLPADADAVFLPRDAMVESRVDDIVAAARARGLAVAAPARVQVEHGALFCYGFSHTDIGRQAARLADQVLRGVSPGDLPVETAESRLVVNRATLARLGLKLAPELAAQVDRFVGEPPP